MSKRFEEHDLDLSISPHFSDIKLMKIPRRRAKWFDQMNQLS